MQLGHNLSVRLCVYFLCSFLFWAPLAQALENLDPNANAELVAKHGLKGNRLHQTIETCESPIFTQNNWGEDVTLPAICKTGTTPEIIIVSFPATIQTAPHNDQSHQGLIPQRLINRSFHLHLRPHRQRTPNRVCFHERLVDIEADEWPRISLSRSGIVARSTNREHQVGYQLILRPDAHKTIRFSVAPTLSEYRGPGDCSATWSLAADENPAIHASISAYNPGN